MGLPPVVQQDVGSTESSSSSSSQEDRAQIRNKIAAIPRELEGEEGGLEKRRRSKQKHRPQVNRSSKVLSAKKENLPEKDLGLAEVKEDEEEEEERAKEEKKRVKCVYDFPSEKCKHC